MLTLDWGLEIWRGTTRATVASPPLGNVCGVKEREKGRVDGFAAAFGLGWAEVFLPVWLCLFFFWVFSFGSFLEDCGSAMLFFRVVVFDQLN